MAQSVILVGFMGAGKTTVGRIVAGNLGWKFTDLDDVIVAREGRSIADIFRTEGEESFRQIETECLRELLQGRPDKTVVALGGGAIAQERNAALVRASAIPVAFLDAPTEVLMARCAPHAGVRPLFADQNQFRQLYEARLGSYMRAGVRIDTASLSPDQVAAEIVRRLDLGGHN